MARLSLRNIWWITLLIITVCSLFVFLWTVPQGDDLVYKSVFNNYSFDDYFVKVPKWIAGHWLGSNGRIGNYLLPTLLALPPRLTALFCAAAVFLLYLFSVLASRRKAPSVVIATVFFLLPWWDGTYLYCVQTNYVWASAVILISYVIVFKEGCLPLWGAVIICFLGGMMHESASASIVAGFFVYYIVRGRKLPRWQIYTVGALCVGSILCVFSPGIILRAGSLNHPDDPWVWLLLKSDFIVIALWLTVLCCALVKKWRHMLHELVYSPAVVLAFASLVGAVISVASGIVFRSGWFAELFAILAFCAWFKPISLVDRYFAPVTLIAVSVVMISCVYWQRIIYRDFNELEIKYAESSDGTVFMDRVRDTDIPMVLTQNRLRGIPDPDDVYLLSVFSEYFGRKGQMPVILPTEAMKFMNGLPEDTVGLSCGDILMRNLPPNVRLINTFTDGTPLRAVDFDGEEWIVQPFGSFYHLSRRIKDPGDRDNLL